MKKFIILALTMLLAVPVFAQQSKVKKIIYVPDTVTTFGDQIKTGDVIYNNADSTFYVSKGNYGRNATLGYLMRSRSRYVVGNTTYTSGVIATTSGTFSTTLGVAGLGTFSSATPLKFTSQAITKGLDFGAGKLSAGSANAIFAYGTWSSPVYLKTASLSGHYVPIQVNINTATSGAYDVAAARFRVDADDDTACTSTFVNVLEGRSALKGAAIAGHAGFNMSTNISGNTTCTGDMVAVLAKFEGSGNVTSSNQVYPFESTVVATGTGIKGVGYFDANGCSVTDNIKAETHNTATLTNMLNLANTSGTVTNGIYMSGTYTHDIRMQKGAFLDNTVTGKLISSVGIVTNCAVPKPFDSTGTLAAADMLRGVITCTSGSTVTMTTPTATAIGALIPGCGQGTTFDLIIDNSGGSNTITVALGSGLAVVTPAITGGATLTISTANAVGLFRFYFTSSSAAKVFRIY